MRVRCIGNKGIHLSNKTLSGVGNKNIDFTIKIGKEYQVYSIVLVKGILMYMIIEEGNDRKPYWDPAELFEVVDNTIPLEWYCDIAVNNYIQAIWGYKEIVCDFNHYVDLIEREEGAMNIFLKRKKEMDEYSELNFNIN